MASGEEVKAFFAHTPPPADVEQHWSRIDTFIRRHDATGTRVVVVTSGGTTVPLERKTVRFIANFSSGLRGALSAEHFLEHGYAVIFLHRKGSVRPFTRVMPSDPLEILERVDDGVGEFRVQVNKVHLATIGDALVKQQKALRGQMLLMVAFETVFDYLYWLRTLGCALTHLERRALFFLASAVSDFYIPYEELPEHKIQSRGEGPSLLLKPVPKMMKLLTHVWAPHAFCVSFKLETDDSILLDKARDSIRQQGVHRVVGNVLGSHHDKVFLITPEQCDTIAKDKDTGTVLEQELIRRIVEAHASFATNK